MKHLTWFYIIVTPQNRLPEVGVMTFCFAGLCEKA